MTAISDLIVSFNLNASGRGGLKKPFPSHQLDTLSSVAGPGVPKAIKMSIMDGQLEGTHLRTDS